MLSAWVFGPCSKRGAKHNQLTPRFSPPPTGFSPIAESNTSSPCRSRKRRLVISEFELPREHLHERHTERIAPVV